jgi:hypothetical protein
VHARLEAARAKQRPLAPTSPCNMGESEQLLGLLTCDFREFKVTKRFPGVQGDQSLKDNPGMLNIQSLSLDNETVP